MLCFYFWHLPTGYFVRWIWPWIHFPPKFSNNIHLQILRIEVPSPGLPRISGSRHRILTLQVYPKGPKDLGRLKDVTHQKLAPLGTISSKSTQPNDSSAEIPENSVTSPTLAICIKRLRCFSWYPGRTWCCSLIQAMVGKHWIVLISDDWLKTALPHPNCSNNAAKSTVDAQANLKCLAFGTFDSWHRCYPWWESNPTHAKGQECITVLLHNRTNPTEKSNAETNQWHRFAREEGPINLSHPVTNAASSTNILHSIFTIFHLSLPNWSK